MLKKDVDIGPIIKKAIHEKKMTIAEFSHQLGFTHGSRAYDLFKMKSIDTDLLIHISNVLNHNFLLEYFEDPPNNRCFLLVETDNSKIEEIMTLLSIDKKLIINKID